MSPQAAKTELRPGSLLSGKYKLQRQLGRGASGAVWAAVNVATSRKVALKVLLRPEPKARERLLREARAAGALKHPNVVDVYDVIVAEDGSPALVLEFLEGQTLEQLIAERAPLPESEVAAIARDVARALAVAHSSGIVHRDLKPANIFLHRAAEDEAPVVKVVDFGISKNTLSREETLTETGMAVGSPSFMSPEQVRGERDLDGRTDLWALGVIMYEMLSAKRLFDGRAHEVLTHVLTQPIKPLRELVAALDPDMDRIVFGLLQRDLARRYASADDVAQELHAVAAKGRSLNPTDSPPTSKSQPRDTSVLEVPKPGVLPVIHEDDEDEEEATHVAPMAMRAALAQRTVPSVYEDEEEDEDDRTRVAPDAVLTAAIQASKQAGPESGRANRDQNTIPTVRPPALSKADADAPAENTITDGPPVTEAGTQVMHAQKAPGAASGAHAEKPSPPAAPPATPPAARVPVSNPSAAKAPVSGAGAVKVPVSAHGKSPIMGPAIGKVPLHGATGKAPLPGAAAGKAPAPGLPAKLSIPKPPEHSAAPHAEEQTPAAPEAVSHAGGGAPGHAAPDLGIRPVHIGPEGHAGAPEAGRPVSERAPAPHPISERAAAKPISERAPAEEMAAPKIVIDKAISERAPPPHPEEHAPASAHSPSSGHDHAADQAHAHKPSAVETTVNRIPTAARSDAVRTWVLTLVVAALVVLAVYLYTHRG